MTSVNFIYCGKDLLGYHISGHAEAENAGESIICAAVSSVAYMVANTITDVLNINATVRVNEDENDDENIFFLKVSAKDAPQCRAILEGLKLHLTALSQQYSENIKLTAMEV